MNDHSESQDASAATPQPLTPLQRRILGVLIEKARTTPDAYPLSLNGLVTGCNQKSNRNPLMNLTPEQVEDELIAMRNLGIVAEVHGGGRVPKYRHYGYDYLGVKGVEAGIMTELLLRGEQTAGDLRTRASRFEPIPDLQTLNGHLQTLVERQLVVALTPPGRGQMFTHNLYSPEELEQVRTQAVAGTPSSGSSHRAPARPSQADSPQWESLQQEVAELRQVIVQLQQRVERLENPSSNPE